MKVTFLAFILLSVTLLGTVRGNSLIRIPVCNPRGRTPSKFKRAMNRARSFARNCRGGKCCSRNLRRDRRAAFSCNPKTNLCLLKTPLIGRSSLNQDRNIIIIVKCSKNRFGCRFSPGKCKFGQILTTIRDSSPLDRIICAWDISNSRSPANCIEIDVSGPFVSARGRRCRKSMGRSVIKKSCELMFSRNNLICRGIRG